MHWTLQVCVALLNILWIAFFLPPEAFSVFVRRRRTNEETLFREFCIQPPAVEIPSNKNNNSETTFQGNSSLAPESETTVRDWDDVGLTSPGGSPEQEPTTPGSPGVTTPGSLPEQEPTTPGSPGVMTPGSPPELGMKTPGRPPEQELRIPGSGSNGNGPDDCCFSFYPRRVNKKLVDKYYLTDRRCQKSGAILVTKQKRHICVDLSLSWVEGIMEFVDGSTV